MITETILINLRCACGHAYAVEQDVILHRCKCPYCGTTPTNENMTNQIVTLHDEVLAVMDASNYGYRELKINGFWVYKEGEYVVTSVQYMKTWVELTRHAISEFTNGEVSEIVEPGGMVKAIEGKLRCDDADT